MAETSLHRAPVPFSTTASSVRLRRALFPSALGNAMLLLLLASAALAQEAVSVGETHDACVDWRP
jgi:hypothetical protein